MIRTFCLRLIEVSIALFRFIEVSIALWGVGERKCGVESVQNRRIKVYVLFISGNQTLIFTVVDRTLLRSLWCPLMIKRTLRSYTWNVFLKRDQTMAYHGRFDRNCGLTSNLHCNVCSLRSRSGSYFQVHKILHTHVKLPPEYLKVTLREISFWTLAISVESFLF